MKNLFTLLIVALALMLLTSCADSKEFTTKQGKKFTVEPYGWANSDAMKNDSVIYQACVGNIVWDILLCETVVVPVVLTGWSLYEPVRLK